MIHVAIAIHDPRGEYACHAGAMLASLFSHTPAPVSAYVLHDSTLTVNNKANLRSIAQRFGKELRFHQVVLPPEVHALGGHVTQGALYRLLLPDLIPLDKIVYFDCDIIFGLDIERLWQIDLQGKPVAAALDPGMPHFPEPIRQRVRETGVALETYFNSGVLVMDLALLRKEYQLYRQAIDFLQRFPDTVFHDQDALNSIFGSHYLPLDRCFNLIVSRALPAELAQPAIRHYAGVKPWDYYSSSQDVHYWKALELTPWQGQVVDRMAQAVSRTWVKVNETLDQERKAYAALAAKMATLTGETVVR